MKAPTRPPSAKRAAFLDALLDARQRAHVAVRDIDRRVAEFQIAIAAAAIEALS
jgi:hypothetical protein